MTDDINGIDPSVPPSGTGCADCDAVGGWWLHLRRCAQCGHIGCCDSSPAQHATAHWKSAGHPLVQSFEPGEEWFWDYATDELYESGPELKPPAAHPADQPTPARPAGSHRTGRDGCTADRTAPHRDHPGPIPVPNIDVEGEEPTRQDATSSERPSHQHLVA